MKIIVTSLSILFCAFTMNVVAQTAKKATKIQKQTVVNERAETPKVKAKKDKEMVEKNIQVLVEAIQKEEKNLAEIQAQKNDPANSNNQMDEAIKASENKINEMTEKLKEENKKLKELDKVINEKE
jgi:ABC-type oligopeptide transport system ATPase subunit